MNAFAIVLYLIGLIAFLFHHNLIMLVISLELLLLSVGVLLVNITSNLDDLVGANPA